MLDSSPIRVHFADFGDMKGVADRILDILGKKYSIVLDAKTPQVLFYSVFGITHTKYDCIRVFYTGEDIDPDFTFCDYAIGFSHISYGKRYLRYPLYLFFERDFNAAVKKHENIDKSILDKKPRFCNFVVSNGGGNPIRRLAFERLSAYKRVDSGGRYLNNIGGAVKDKFAFQRECKFSLCFENTSTSGYLTEKLIQAAAAQTIPIYFGDNDAFSALSSGGGGEPKGSAACKKRGRFRFYHRADKVA